MKDSTALVAMALRLGVPRMDQDDLQGLDLGESGATLVKARGPAREVCETDAVRQTNRVKKKGFRVKRQGDIVRKDKSQSDIEGPGPGTCERQSLTLKRLGKGIDGKMDELYLRAM